MKKKMKKLRLSKETVRGLNLERVVGASELYTQCYCSYYSNCRYICDVPETTFPTCIA